MPNLTGRPIYQKTPKTSKPRKGMKRVSDKKAGESEKLTKSAKGESCTLRIPCVCNGDSSTTVFC